MMIIINATILYITDVDVHVIDTFSTVINTIVVRVDCVCCCYIMYMMIWC